MNRLAIPAAVLSACAVMAVPASGQNNGVEVRIGAVVASNTGQSFDDRLIALRKQFIALFPYSSYQLIHEEKRQVQWGNKAGFDLPGGRFLVVIPREYKNNLVSLQIMLISDTRPIVQTVLALKNNGTFLVGGPRYRDGVLLIAIGANTENRADQVPIKDAASARAATGTISAGK